MHNYSSNHSVDKRQQRSTAEPGFTDQVRTRPSGEKYRLTWKHSPWARLFSHITAR